MKDVFGKALLDFQNGNYTEDIITWTSISEEDEIPLPYLFRPFDDMPAIEQEALNLASGKVLDVGCGAGNHSLYLQDKKGLEVKSIDISKNAISVCQLRHLRNPEVLDILDEKECFDTILFLMNGSGIFQELSKVPFYLNHLKTLLNPGGQILMDSSDIRYMYMDETETSVDYGALDNITGYFGDLDFFISYKGEKENPMKWIYIDYDTLKDQCDKSGLKCEKIMDGLHFDYLARISHQ